MNTKVVHRIFAFLSFAIALVVYLLTVQPTVPFWDCGEFIAAAVHQQVPHPPGAPLFLMIGKVFHTLIPFGDQAWRVNLVSVVSSALVVLFTYLITVRLLRLIYRKSPETPGQALAVYGSAFIGAMALTFSDTFWFNAVEAEVYAMSTLFVALIVYLMLRWYMAPDRPGNEWYLLLIAYLIGLSTGVHLLSILTIFSLVMLVYFRYYPFTWKTFFGAGLLAVLVFWIVYPGVVKWFPTMLAGDLPFRTPAREHVVEDSPMVRLLAIAILVGVAVLFWRVGYKQKKPLVAIAAGSFLLIILGYTTYVQVLLRANAHPPMNENAPTTLDKLVSYLNREQYGEAPLWPRRYQTDDYIARNYEKYGKWYPPEYVPVRRKDGSRISIPKFTRINAGGELNYLWSYQIQHMYFRYFAWNFVGRMSDIQDAPAAFFPSEQLKDQWLYQTPYKFLFPIQFFALPLLFGLIGLVVHWSKDRRTAFVFFILFLVLGVVAAIAQNQQEPQPRERDYFYAGSFMVWAIWIGIGVMGVIEWISARQKSLSAWLESRQMPSLSTAVVAAILIVALLAVPVNMAIGGWEIHDRSDNYMPFDYAYNILQSVEPDAIVFTNGDNDTFPVWYMQDVEGVRRDVRIVNLSLGNTLWYIYQLKNESPWGAKKIPLSFPDEKLLADEYSPEALSYEFGPAKTVEIPVKPEILAQFTDDTTIINRGAVEITFTGRPMSKRDGEQMYLFRVQDLLVIDILKQTKFERPVYYSSSVGPDAYCGLEDYFRAEGLAYRICPVPVSRGIRSNYAVNEAVMDQTLLNVLPDEEFYREFHYGMKLRNLTDSGAYYDEPNRRPISSYRAAYLNYAYALFRDLNKPDKGAAVLDTMNKYISPELFPMPYPMNLQVAELYDRAGKKEQARRFALQTIQQCKLLIEKPYLRDQDYYARSYDPYITAARAYELIKDYDGAIAMLEQYVAATGDKTTQARIDQLRIQKYEVQGDYKQALQVAEEILTKYQQSDDRLMRALVPALERKITDLRHKLRGDTAAAFLDTEDAGDQQILLP